MGNMISSSEPIGNDEERNENLVDISPINVKSPLFFHLYNVGNSNDTSLSRSIFQNSTINRGYYLYLDTELFIVVHLSVLNLVTQSL
jgi:hypothetical protein